MAQEVKYLSFSGLNYFWNDKLKPIILENEQITALALTDLNNKITTIRRDYLQLIGGTLTGPIAFNGSDTNRNVIRINSTTGDATKIGDYGYTLKFLGSGSGINNALALYADNQAATTQNLATKWLNDGTMYARSILPHTNNTFDLGSSSLKWKNVYATTFTGNLTGDVTGNASTATKASTVAIAANSDNVACELWFQDSSRDGNRGKLTYDNDLRYNPSKNTLMIGGMTSSVTTPTTANVVLDGTNKKLSLGESYIQYNSSTGCLEIIA